MTKNNRYEVISKTSTGKDVVIAVVHAPDEAAATKMAARFTYMVGANAGKLRKIEEKPMD